MTWPAQPRRIAASTGETIQLTRWRIKSRKPSRVGLQRLPTRPSLPGVVPGIHSSRRGVPSALNARIVPAPSGALSTLTTTASWPPSSMTSPDRAASYGTVSRMRHPRARSVAVRTSSLEVPHSSTALKSAVTLRVYMRLRFPTIRHATRFRQHGPRSVRLRKGTRGLGARCVVLLSGRGRILRRCVVVLRVGLSFRIPGCFPLLQPPLPWRRRVPYADLAAEQLTRVMDMSFKEPHGFRSG